MDQKALAFLKRSNLQTLYNIKSLKTYLMMIYLFSLFLFKHSRKLKRASSTVSIQIETLWLFYEDNDQKFCETEWGLINFFEIDGDPYKEITLGS